jgi:hypothetical protein
MERCGILRQSGEGDPAGLMFVAGVDASLNSICIENHVTSIDVRPLLLSRCLCSDFETFSYGR